MEIMRVNSKAVRAGQGERKRHRTNANAPPNQQRNGGPHKSAAQQTATRADGPNGRLLLFTFLPLGLASGGWKQVKLGAAQAELAAV